MKQHNIDPSQPVGVQQWNTILALNYVAKGMGVKRGMTAYEALVACPTIMLIHISTIECEHQDEETHLEMGLTAPKYYDKAESKPSSTVGKFLPSSICETKLLSTDPELEPFRRYWVKMRDKQS
jgi:nucleotidyltransferase/DNA polymerase involved in DNA repair